MKSINFKALAYSLLLTILLVLLVVFLDMKEVNIVSLLILSVLPLVSFLIILWNNEPMIHYFWRGRPDWLKTSDHWFLILLGAVIYISINHVWYSYHDEGYIHLVGCFMCLSAAFSYRRIYLNHAPEDIEQYERERKCDEEANTFVTVAVCKDVGSARIIRSMLESNGLEAITYGENYPEFIRDVPVRVLVRRRYKETAEKLINE